MPLAASSLTSGIVWSAAMTSTASGFVALMFVAMDEKLFSAGSKVSVSPYTTFTPPSFKVLSTSARNEIPYSSLNTAMARFLMPSCAMRSPMTTPCTVSGGIVRKK